MRRPPNRTTRLAALVTATEANQIARRATATGLSVSAYLRERALSAHPDQPAALPQIDTLIARMESDLDSANRRPLRRPPRPSASSV